MPMNYTSYIRPEKNSVTLVGLCHTLLIRGKIFLKSTKTQLMSMKYSVSSCGYSRRGIDTVFHQEEFFNATKILVILILCSVNPNYANLILEISSGLGLRLCLWLIRVKPNLKSKPISNLFSMIEFM